MTKYGGLNKKQIIEMNTKHKYTGVYFKDEKRIMTYAGITLTDASLELMRLTKKEKTIISMIIIPEGKMPELYLSWNKSDYEQFIETL